MKTFKFSLVALATTALLTACSNEVIEPQVKSNGEAQEISFRLQGGMPEVETYALATTRDNLEAFVVFGTDVVGSTNTLLFNGKSVVRQLDGTFAYAPKAYYSAGATKAGFFAFAPVSANVSSPTFSNDFLTAGASFGYEVLPPDNSGDAIQEDFLVVGTVVTPSTTAVNLTFDHALSRIFVTATNLSADPVIIKDITLKNLNTKGTLKVTNAAAWSWTSVNTLDDYTYILAPSGVVVPGGTNTKTLVTSMEQGMMVLPQELQITGTGNVANDDFALEITYEFANFGTQTRYVYIPEVSPGTPYEFEAGYQYNINIAFDGLLPIDFVVVDVNEFESPIIVN